MADDKKKTLTLKPGTGGRRASKGASGVEVVRMRKQRRTASDLQHGQSKTASLSDKERSKQLHALEQMSHSSEERKKIELLKAEDERQRLKQHEEEKKLKELEKENRRQQEETRKRAEEEIRKKAEAIAEREQAKVSERQVEDGSSIRSGSDSDDFADKVGSARVDKNKRRRSGGRVRDEGRRSRGGKINVSVVIGEDGEVQTDETERTRSMASLRRMRSKEKQKLEEANVVREKIIRDVVIPDAVTVGELANRMAERTADVIKELLKNNIVASRDQLIDGDTAELIVHEFGHRSKRVSQSDIEDSLLVAESDDISRLLPRPAVVTVMGHVDHGKTSLLDALRHSSVTGGEAGGITQHIGAYQITTENKQLITFIDTPGHAAFTEMRARGARVTDIVVLVVAADDGVQPQTVEAIDHAKAADVPVIIAINKCDKANADTAKIYMELAQHGLQAESMGGAVQAVEISAKEGTHLDSLVEAILLQSEILELKGNAGGQGRGVIVEARLEKGRGSMATVLVQSGEIKVGDIFVAGQEWGKVRALLDEKGRQVKSAEISKPVEVVGLNGTPMAGDDLVVVDNESKAREISEYRTQKHKESKNIANKRSSLEQMFSQAEETDSKILNIIIKTDVQGSLEAIRTALAQLNRDGIEVSILHAAVGGINESDITLASSVGALVIGFNVRPNAQARALAKRDNIDIRFYSIIYNLLDDIELMLKNMIAPETAEEILGYAEVREVFNISKIGKIAGCMINEGLFKRSAHARILREDTVVFNGRLKQLKRFKDDVREVQQGYECGISLENFEDLKIGDRIECYEIKENRPNA